MSWRIVAACEVGTSHALTQAPCQDSCWAQADVLSDGRPLLSLFVADGAGSAACGGQGAELAMEAVAGFVGEQVVLGQRALDEALARELVECVRQRIDEEAQAQGRRTRDYSCTLLGLLCTPTVSLALQIGDGGVVLDQGQGLELAIVPMSGEYANMTHFVTDEDALDNLQTRSYSGRVTRAAAFTDGIQRLALNMAAGTVHEPFFTPFFSGMARATAEQEDMLQALLLKFLGSAPVNERTDDDKTLALALWNGAANAA